MSGGWARRPGDATHRRRSGLLDRCTRFVAATGLLCLAPGALAAQGTPRAPSPATPAPRDTVRAGERMAGLARAASARRGIVTDTVGAPVRDASVRDVKTGALLLSDSLGRFELRGPRVGSVSLEVSAAGYERMSFDFDAVPGDTSTLVIPLTSSAEPPPLPFAKLPASLAGRVLDQSGRPLDDANVQVITALKEVRTDTLGRFALAQLPVGRHLVRVRRVGYAAESFFATITDSTSARLVVALTPLGQDLGTVTVRARAGTRRLEQFERRRQRLAGFGTFVMRDEIDARNPLAITDMLRTTRGVTVSTDARGRTQLVGRGQCLMAVRVDGIEVPIDDWGIDTFVAPQDVAAIEVYPGDGATPPELRSQRSNCGVVAIWTR